MLKYADHNNRNQKIISVTIFSRQENIMRQREESRKQRTRYDPKRKEKRKIRERLVKPSKCQLANLYARYAKNSP